jgi:hypothetical protein
MKKLLHYYEFTPSQNKIVIDGIYKPERFLLITNVTANQTIFTFNSTTAGLNSITYDYPNEKTTLILDYNCSAMSSTDKLQIFAEQDFGNFEPSDTFVDPVSKLRVSQPSNLIDTDFEYGLQSTKWETLEKVKNIPTFFARNGDADLVVSDIQTVSGSDVVTVTLSEVHTLSPGSPVIILGSKNITCDGGFVVVSVPNDTTILYKAKGIQSFTGSIKDTYTQVFPGSLYTGTEFDISGIEGIVTDGNSSSSLTVTTAYPTEFSVNTSFFLSNSKGTVALNFDTANVQPNTYIELSTTVNNNTATNESNTGFMIGAVNPYDFDPLGAFYFTASDITVDSAQDTVTFNFNHGITDNTPYLYVVGEGNTGITGLATFNGYYVRVLNSTTVYFTDNFGGTTRIQISGSGSNGGVMRSALIRAWRILATDSSGFNGDAVLFDQNHDFNFSTDNNLPVAFFDGSTGSAVTVNTTLASVTAYYFLPDSSNTSDVTRWARFRYTFNGSVVQWNNVGLTNVGAFMIKMRNLTDNNSIYFPNHGYTTGSLATFTTVSGVTPGGLSSGALYNVEAVSANRLRFRTTAGGSINLTSIGSSDGIYTVSSRVSNANNESITIQNHNLSDGTAVIYNNDSNTAIGGLTNGTTYYVFQSTLNTIKLATTPLGWITSSISINHGFTNFGTDVFTATIGTTVIAHGFTTGQAVRYSSSTPLPGLINGAWYWVRVLSSSAFSFHWTKDGAINNTDRVNVEFGTGTGFARTANLVDITSTGSGTQSLEAVSNNAADGVYKLTEKITDTSFKITANNELPLRKITITSSLDLNRNAFFVPNHGLITGTPVTYTSTSTVMSGLTNDTTYYVIRYNNNWFKLASSLADAESSINVSITSNGTGIHRLTTSIVSGEVLGSGTVSISNTTTKIVGVGTNFPAVFTSGNTIKLYKNPSQLTGSISGYDAANDTFTTPIVHNFTTGNSLYFNSADVVPQNIELNKIYYVRVLTTQQFTLHATPLDATNNTNRIDFVGTGTNLTYVQVQNEAYSTTLAQIKLINSTNELELLNAVTEDFTNVNYAVSTSLLLRSDGFALHRPYDGGVELIPSTNPDSSMVRQTRKYFRYQSGKGIQVSFAINFSPTTTIDTMSRVGTTATIVTRYPHRLTQGLDITIFGATTSSGTNYWNGTFEVASIVDQYTFTVTLLGTPVNSVADGIIEFYVDGWTNSETRCGLFDDQNGLFFEYNGSVLNCVRRSSTQQISGTASVSFKDAVVVGTNTKFLSQLDVGEKIVIKGQTYVISKIESNTLLYILPSYRGVDSTNVIITKTVDTKIPQSQWNIDVCDGTGPTGFYLDIHKIQMAYMDYSWYGAGKVRFGFKDQRGKVVYVHEFIHNNKFTEAYMRSGNIPARYEIENIGEPSYVPALAHWGTSVIMDGRFDDDKAYIFSATSNQISITGSASVIANCIIDSTSTFYVLVGNQYREAGRALSVVTPSASFNSIPPGVSITGSNVPAGTLTRVPISTQITPYQVYLPGVTTRHTNPFNTSSQATRNLLLISNSPTATTTVGSNYTVTLSSAVSSVVYEQPLISIRLSPSVDNGTPGLLGEREIINRMQLILNSVGIQSTHTCEVTLKLNGQLNNYAWKRVTNPSLSQLIYHDTSDRITGGTTVYTFRASGSTGTTGRVQLNTVADLGDIVTLGNSILGGDNVFPDGPDILTVVVRLIEDPSTVTASNQFIVGGRISWSESQA